MQTRLRNLWPFLFISSVIFILFLKLFFPLSIFITPDYGRSDAWHLSIANKYYYAQELKKNYIPLWNPHIGTGYPTLAEGQTGVFFLPNLIVFRLFPFVFAYNLSLVLTFILAASGVFFFCRSLNFNRITSIYAGLVFALGGFFMVHVQHIHLIQTAAMMPWLFWQVNEFLKNKRITNLVFTSLILSQQIFAGFPQLTFYSLVALTIFFLLKLPQRSRFKYIPIYLCSIILGLGLAAIQILPTYEFLKISTRTPDPAAVLKAFPYKPINLIQFIRPFALGTPQDGSYPLWQPGEWGIFWESTTYIGLIPLSLSLAVLLSQLFKNKDIQRKNILLFGLLGLMSLLLALGFWGPLHPIFSFPPLSIFRVPSRFLLIVQFAMVILSAFFLQKIKNRFVVCAIILISIADLYIHFANYNPIDKAQKWLEDPQTAQIIKPGQGGRVYTIGQMEAWNKVFKKSGWQDTNYYYFARNFLDQNSNLIFGIDQFSAYESLLTKRSSALNGLITNGIKIKNEKVALEDSSLRLLTVENVGYFISPFEIENQNVEKEAEVKENQNTVYIFKNRLNPKRLFMTDKYKIAGTIPQLASQLTTNDFSPQEEVIIEKAPKTEMLLTHWSGQIVRDSSDSIEIDASVAGKGLLILSDSYYPDWKAYVDEKETEIFAANINERALLLNEGNHRVVFKYRPESLYQGLAISVLSSISIFLILVLSRRHHF